MRRLCRDGMMATRFRFMSMKASRLPCKGDERNQTRWCVKPSGNNALAFKSQQEGRSRFANDMSKETHDGDPLAIKAERPSTTRDLAALGLTSLKCTGRSQGGWLADLITGCGERCSNSRPVAVKSHKRHNAHRWIVSKTKAT